MGLDGGTIITRSDILRGSSWDVANADGGASTSTRGGQVGDAYVHKRRRIDPAVGRRGSSTFSFPLLPSSFAFQFFTFSVTRSLSSTLYTGQAPDSVDDVRPVGRTLARAHRVLHPGETLQPGMAPPPPAS
jgi:hypothetical protein